LKRIYFTVTNDLVYDQRMIRICRSLAAGGYSVVLVGRRLADSPPLNDEPFEQIRLRCLLRKGKGFYLEYNLRLLLFLWFRRMDAICAIDLDTILPCLWVSRRKDIPRIYDAHELFTEMKEVIARPRIKAIWDRIERYAVPQFALGSTVSRSIVEEFRRRYGVDYELIRNLPLPDSRPQSLSPATGTTDSPPTASKETRPSPAGIKDSFSTTQNTPRQDRYILYQGAVNEARGLESLIAAMRHVDSRLLICGAGNLMDHCLRLTAQYGLAEKIIFRGMVDPAELRQITNNAYIGVNLIEAFGLNQYYSLANKFFDYIQAGVPQLTMDFPEYRLVHDRYPIGLLIPDTDEKKIAAALNNLLADDVLYGMFKDNCQQARQVYNWREEEKNLLRFYKKIFG
jgi:glycosyltransferase involved in cell wall biosynthesis